KPFLLRTARTRVRRAAKKAGLPELLTLAAWRHGGLTELGDAELTESGIIALSGHRTADAARGYVKRTDVQQKSGLFKRRAWVQAAKEEGRQEEKKWTRVGIEPLPGSRNECGELSYTLGITGRGSRIRPCGPLHPKVGDHKEIKGFLTIPGAFSARSIKELASESEIAGACGAAAQRALNSSPPEIYPDQPATRHRQLVADVALDGVGDPSKGATSIMGINTYDSATEAEADRTQQKALLAALNAWDLALRQAESG